MLITAILNTQTDCHLKLIYSRIATEMNAWLLFVTVLVLSADYCNSAFPRSNRGDPGGGVIVQLFRWRYEDIARECEEFLAPKGYGAVEVAPITEHVVQSGKKPSWDEPYYPVSYKIYSRSGDEKSFKEMVERCNKAGIKVYVTVVMAYMPKYPDQLQGYGKSTANANRYDYPAVPYDQSAFTKQQCRITWRYTIEEMRTCDMRLDHHLNHANPNVRQTLRDFLNKLISFGVAGFSVDAVNRIHPDHLKAIYSRLRYLNISHGFACETEPYIYHEYDEVKSLNDEAAKDYYALGILADYNYRYDVNQAFSGQRPLLKLLTDIQSRTELLPDDRALVFLDSQTAQKKYSMYRLTYFWPKGLIPATVFMLAYPFGQPRIPTNYDYPTLNDAPPIEDDKIAPIKFNGENCTGGWVCEHRWPAIYNMIKFRDVVGDASVTNVWQDENNNMAFSRGNKGFVLFTSNPKYQITTFSQTIQTGLPKGEYCDIITGTLEDNTCTGKVVSVDDKGFTNIVKRMSEIGAIAIHIEAKVK